MLLLSKNYYFLLLLLTVLKVILYHATVYSGIYAQTYMKGSKNG